MVNYLRYLEQLEETIMSCTPQNYYFFTENYRKVKALHMKLIPLLRTEIKIFKIFPESCQSFGSVLNYRVLTVCINF
jgi:hypothetical protein